MIRYARESPASPAEKTTRGSVFAAKLGKEKGSPGGENEFASSPNFSHNSDLPNGGVMGRLETMCPRKNFLGPLWPPKLIVPGTQCT